MELPPEQLKAHARVSQALTRPIPHYHTIVETLATKQLIYLPLGLPYLLFIVRKYNFIFFNRRI